jgi:CubicO group peptidase (beta-lactamase class C family)
MTTSRTQYAAIAIALVSAVSARVWTAAPQVAVADTAQAISQFKAFYEQAVRDQRIVGSSVRVVHDGRVVASDVVGAANLDPSRVVDDDTIFHWGSITKTLTGIAILQLRDQGLLKLDDPIVKYIPELRSVHNPYGSMEEITIRHLLTHSSGFRNPTWPWGGDQPWQPFEPAAWSQLAAMFPYTEILFKPGTKFSYSNPGFIFLGRVIELLTTDDYEVYVDKNIFKPLDMTRSYFDTTPNHLKKNRARSYYLMNGSLVPAVWDQNTGITVSNGGLNAPLGDLVKYLGFLAGDPSKQREYDGILQRSTLEEMWRPAVPMDVDGAATGARGLAFQVEDRSGYHLVGHGGSQNAFNSQFYLDPASRTVYVVAFNTEADPATADAPGNVTKLSADIRDYLLQHIFPLFRNRS